MRFARWSGGGGAGIIGAMQEAQVHRRVAAVLTFLRERD
jgi:hypothetical protein